MISAILLAAGQSKRMKGQNKLTKKIQDIPLIKHSVKNILSSNIDELIIVLGHQKEAIKKIVENNEKIKFIFNKNFKSGMASSIRIGLKHLSDNTEFFFICLGDMPLVNKDIYNELIKSKNNNEIIVPTYKGEQGNPILFSKTMKAKIMTVQGDSGAKMILQLNEDKVFNFETNNENVVKNFNTIESFNS